MTHVLLMRRLSILYFGGCSRYFFHELDHAGDGGVGGGGAAVLLAEGGDGAIEGVDLGLFAGADVNCVRCMRWLGETCLLSRAQPFPSAQAVRPFKAKAVQRLWQNL